MSSPEPPVGTQLTAPSLFWQGGVLDVAAFNGLDIALDEDGSQEDGGGSALDGGSSLADGDDD